MPTGMKKIFVSLLALLGGSVAVLCVIAARYEAKIVPNTFVGPVSVGGMAPPEAAKKLRIWWETEKRVPLKLVCEQVKNPLPEMTAGQLGVALDDIASVQPLPVQDFVGAATSVVGQGGEAKHFELKFKASGQSLEHLEKLVRESAGEPKKAVVKFVNGEIVRTPETSALRLKKEALTPAVVEALQGDLKVKVPVEQAPKHVPDEQLATITELVQPFTTHFPARMISRNNNIKVASGKLNGIVLMPGDHVSFNETVGRRTIEAGFQEAGVYKNGKHDHGIGGGICQVSTTLYNAALFANLGIVHRHNHSMPVPYVPLGRDATVDYGSIDLELVNTYPGPIAITSEYENGSLTFRIFGKKDPALSVKVITDGHKSWDRGIKVTQDKSLKPGTHKIVDKGSMGHSINSYRLVYKNGVLEKKESLGRSYYAGAVRLISANGPYPPVKLAKAPLATSAPAAR